MKVLTDEAKIHLATKIDDYELDGDAQYPLFKKPNFEIVDRHEYNPNQPNSTYCMKYLSGIWLAVGKDNGRWKKLLDQFNINILIHPADFLEEVLEMTGYKGEIWND